MATEELSIVDEIFEVLEQQHKEITDTIKDLNAKIDAQQKDLDFIKSKIDQVGLKSYHINQKIDRALEIITKVTGE